MQIILILLTCLKRFTAFRPVNTDVYKRQSLNGEEEIVKVQGSLERKVRVK